MPGKNLTLYVDQSLAEEMEKVSEVNWSEIARRAISQYLQDRLRSTIPADLVSKLRTQRSQESTNGREYALKSILPRLSYKELEKMMTDIFEKTKELAEKEADEVGASVEEVDWAGHRIDAAIELLKFRIPAGTSHEFVKGALETLSEAYELAKKG